MSVGTHHLPFVCIKKLILAFEKAGPILSWHVGPSRLFILELLPLDLDDIGIIIAAQEHRRNFSDRRTFLPIPLATLHSLLPGVWISTRGSHTHVVKVTCTLISTRGTRTSNYS
eukprot:1159778-Pelagomonas_calceolata.AAC.15